MEAHDGATANLQSQLQGRNGGDLSGRPHGWQPTPVTLMCAGQTLSEFLPGVGGTLSPVASKLKRQVAQSDCTKKPGRIGRSECDAVRGLV